ANARETASGSPSPPAPMDRAPAGPSRSANPQPSIYLATMLGHCSIACMGLVAWRKIRPISTRDHDPARTSAACPSSSPVAEQPALSAADPDLAVLGGQHRAGAPCRRPRAAPDAVVRPLDRHLSDPAALCLAAPEAGLAGAARASADDAVPVVRRVRLQQCNLLLGPAIYRGAERAFDPVVGSAVC